MRVHMAPIVSVVHTEDFSEKGLRNATFDAIDKSGFKFPKGINSAMLKVNLRYYWDSSTGETTDPRIVSAIIDYVRHRCDDEIEIVIAEADASAMRVKHAFRMLGYEELAQRKGVKLVNLCECEKVERRVVVNGRTLNLPVAEGMLNSDLLINVTTLRTHRLTTVSCCLKNMFGAIARARKIVYHPYLNEAIVGINKLIKPDFAVVDGIISLGKTPIKMGLILAGEDQVAVDSVVAKVMGYNPQRIRHLKLARKEGVGTLDNITINGVKDLTKFSMMFPRENYFVFNLLWDLKLAALDAYLKITKDTRPPVLDR
jgi:uncharacterized protein (DUF362 family)